MIFDYESDSMQKCLITFVMVPWIMLQSNLEINVTTFHFQNCFAVLHVISISRCTIQCHLWKFANPHKTYAVWNIISTSIYNIELFLFEFHLSWELIRFALINELLSTFPTRNSLTKCILLLWKKDCIFENLSSNL